VTWKERLIGIPLAVLGAALLLGTAAGMLLTRTDWGRERVRSFTLERLNGAIRGRVEIDAVLEGDLLHTVRLAGVRIYEPDGREFARVDTLAVFYRWSDFLIGNVTLPKVTLVAPVVRLRVLSEGGWNVSEIFKGRRPSAASPQAEGRESGGGPRVVLREVMIRAGDVSLGFPWDPASGGDPDSSRWHLERVDGSWQRVIRVERFHASLPIARVAAPRGLPRLFQVSQFACRATVVGPPFEVEQVRADVEVRGDTLAFDVWEGDLPGSRVFGQGWVTLAGELEYDLAVRGNPVTTDDLSWLIPRLPSGVARLDFRYRSLEDGIALEAQNAEWQSPDARLSGRFAMTLRDRPDGLQFDSVALEVGQLNTRLIGSLTGWDPPFEGGLAGWVGLDGSLSELQVDADVRVQPEGEDVPSRLRAVGIVHATRDALGGQGLELQFDTVSFNLIRAFVPGLTVRGEVTGNARIDGRLAEGLVVDFAIEQRDRDLVPTRLRGRSTIRAGADSPVALKVDADVDSLSLTTLSQYYPQLPLRGDFRGKVRVAGVLDDLDVQAGLGGLGDSLRIRGNVGLATGLPRYRGEIRGWRVQLAEFREGLPESDLDFRIEFEGQGARLRELTTAGRVDLFASFVGGVRFDSASAALRIADGRLQVDTALVRGEFGELHASGALSLVPEEADSLLFELNADSLGGLGPWLFPTQLAAAAGLVTRGGSEPASEAGIARIEGSARVHGWIVRGPGRFAAHGSVEGESLAYAEWAADSLRVEWFEVGEYDGQLRAAGELHGVGADLGELHFAEVRLNGRLADTVTTVGFEVAKETAAATGRAWVSLGTASRVIGLDTLTLRIGTATWELTQPARVRLEESGALAVEGFEFRSGAKHVDIEGSVGVAGPVSLSVRLAGLDLANAATLWPDSLAVAGTLELNAQLSGRVASPVVQGSFDVSNGHLFGVAFSSFSGTLDYDEGEVALDASVWQEPKQLFRVHGTLPLDLQLPRFGLSLAERPIDVRLEGDSIPLATVTVFTDQISELRGHARASIHLTGTPAHPSLEGPVSLANGAFRVVRTGISYEGLEGQAQFDGDVLVLRDVAFRSTGGGRGVLSGTIGLADPGNPEFGLELVAEGLPSYDQLDARLLLSGRVRLHGPYEQPVISGNLAVVSGVLFIEEIGRQSQIIDPFEAELPRLDRTPALEGELRRGSGNPFLEHLTIDVGVRVERDTWLRSGEANVEIAGDLTVRMQRAQGELRINGTLHAVRGDYRLFNKRFAVVEGAVEFVGTPAMNPNLNMIALYTVRTQKRPLDIRLVIGGTLEDPTLSLESDAQPPISESDLLSYLLFGRPSYELTRASEEGSLLADVTSGVPQAFFGYALESLLVGGTGIAYVDVSRAPQTGVEDEYAGGVAPALTATQVEVGWYLAPTIFVSVAQQLVGVVRPTVRLEWKLGENLTLRGITEPRFGPEGTLLQEGSSTDLEQSIGVFLFYGWAY